MSAAEPMLPADQQDALTRWRRLTPDERRRAIAYIGRAAKAVSLFGVLLGDAGSAARKAVADLEALERAERERVAGGEGL
jgi:ribosomal 50S subunit-associated protein YjgA (DUF615 family)